MSSWSWLRQNKCLKLVNSTKVIYKVLLLGGINLVNKICNCKLYKLSILIKKLWIGGEEGRKRFIFPNWSWWGEIWLRTWLQRKRVSKKNKRNSCFLFNFFLFFWWKAVIMGRGFIFSTSWIEYLKSRFYFSPILTNLVAYLHILAIFSIQLTTWAIC